MSFENIKVIKIIKWGHALFLDLSSEFISTYLQQRMPSDQFTL